jgi:hypothetical protein
VAVKMLESAPSDRAESKNSRQSIGGGGGQQHANISIDRGQDVSLTAAGQGARRACRNATSVPHHTTVTQPPRTHARASSKWKGVREVLFWEEQQGCGWLVIVQTSRATSSTLFECTHDNLHDREYTTSRCKHEDQTQAVGLPARGGDKWLAERDENTAHTGCGEQCD